MKKHEKVYNFGRLGIYVPPCLFSILFKKDNNPVLEKEEKYNFLCVKCNYSIQ